MVRTKFHILSIILLLALIACKKEYSYEGGSVPPFPDSIINTTPKAWICPSCTGADNYIESKWSFYNDTAFYCGVIDTAIATPDRNGFTFFGPYACSIDSGVVLTINIQPVILNKDVYNSTTNKVGLYYYDNIGQTHPFVSQPGFPFSLTIDSYIHQTRMMTGRFGGTVFKPNGQPTTINGKFKMRIL